MKILCWLNMINSIMLRNDFPICPLKFPLNYEKHIPITAEQITNLAIRICSGYPFDCSNSKQTSFFWSFSHQTAQSVAQKDENCIQWKRKWWIEFRIPIECYKWKCQRWMETKCMWNAMIWNSEIPEDKCRNFSFEFTFGSFTQLSLDIVELGKLEWRKRDQRENKLETHTV